MHTWIDYLAWAIAAADAVLWVMILRMHLQARWTSEAAELRAAKKARLDREKKLAMRRMLGVR